MITTRYDVVVIGAGSAGIAAAVAAARHGARVCLLERDDRVGGNATNAMVGTICGLSRCGREAPRAPSFDNPGFSAEFSRRVAEASRTSLVMNDDGLVYLPYREEALRAVIAQMIEEHPSMSLATRASPSAISYSAASEEFEIVLAPSESGARTLCAPAIVDSSGDAVASRLLSLPVIEPDPPQAASLIFKLEGLPNLDERALGFALRKALIEASVDNSLSKRLTYVSMVPGSLVDGSALFKLGTTSPLDEASAARIWDEASGGICEIVDVLRQRSKSFEYIQHTFTAPRMGVRSGGRGTGEERLSDEAVRLSERHIKGIALGLWPAEIWLSPERPTVTFPERGCSYEIPVGALCAQTAPGLYFAGRTISATDYAFASARVIGTCLSTGYAAGRLAAGEARGERRDSIVSSIRAEQVDPFHHLLQAKP